MAARVIVLIGLSGCGKTTLIDHIVARDSRVRKVPSFTTRPRESRDQDGTYEFITREDFERLSITGTIVQHVRYNGNIYGNDESQFALPDGAIGILAMTEAGANALIALGYDVRTVKVVGIGARIRMGRERADLGRIDTVKTDCTIENRFEVGGLECAIRDLSTFINAAF